MSQAEKERKDQESRAAPPCKPAWHWKSAPPQFVGAALGRDLDLEASTSYKGDPPSPGDFWGTYEVQGKATNTLCISSWLCRCLCFVTDVCLRTFPINLGERREVLCFSCTSVLQSNTPKLLKTRCEYTECVVCMCVGW